MFRFRRYRLFLLVAVVATATVYHLTHVRNWEVPGVEGLRNFGLKIAEPLKTASPIVPTSTSSSSSVLAPAYPTDPLETSSTSKLQLVTPPTSSSRAEGLSTPSTSASSKFTSTATFSSIYTGPSLKSRPIESDEDREAVSPPAIEELDQHGQGRVEIPLRNTELEKPVWVQQKEHFPLPKESLIALPTGSSKEIPRIQHVFADESLSAKADREKKQAIVKEAFQHAWSGYTKHAMLHDELAPVSGEVKDPFNGWGATLVDTLDTLWIMGLHENFEEAVNEVQKINFKTSLRKDIPLFETVIRYLGGLLSAYDLSSGKYTVLLDKAVELAEILMGAFDTPNRMPVTFYYWTPSYASQSHRAGARAVLAEIGSLSLEFTRLAQITKEPRYYDAIARITNELEHLQNHTALPGLWPTVIDASGCKKPKRPTLHMTSTPSQQPDDMVDESEILDVPIDEETIETSFQDPKHGMVDPPPGNLKRRQLDDAGFLPAEDPVASVPNSKVEEISPQSSKKIPQVASPPTIQGDNSMEVECEPQRLALPPYTKKAVYSIGGQADSTYEYLPKEYMLLGGLNDQYQTMYKDAADVIREKLIFRPMTKDNRDILSVGSYQFRNKLTSSPVYDGSHLTCFAGGMFAVGAKVFNIPEDLDIAKKLTNGCIWAYESTTTGIMPETFELVPCDNLASCEWNETQYKEALDPDWRLRERHAAQFEKNRQEFQEKMATQTGSPTQTPHPGRTSLSGFPDDNARFGSRHSSGFVESSPAVKDTEKRSKRQLVAASENKEGLSVPSSEVPTTTKKTDILDDISPPMPQLPSFSLPAVLSHDDFVAARIQEERLPPGFKSISNRKYILRPEAIESVFIMYRITGDEYWREKGWKMFTAIQGYTLTEIANSAISDVTSSIPVFADTMESFWLAETLKYFYLLYSDPSLVSLDDYVLNTEAHPFKRPH